MANRSEYIVDIRGDTSQIEAAVARVDGTLEKIGKTEHLLKFKPDVDEKSIVQPILKLVDKQNLKFQVELEAANVDDLKNQLKAKEMVDSDLGEKGLKKSEAIAARLKTLLQEIYEEEDKAFESGDNSGYYKKLREAAYYTEGIKGKVPNFENTKELYNELKAIIDEQSKVEDGFTRINENGRSIDLEDFGATSIKEITADLEDAKTDLDSAVKDYNTAIENPYQFKGFEDIASGMDKAVQKTKELAEAQEEVVSNTTGETSSATNVSDIEREVQATKELAEARKEASVNENEEKTSGADISNIERETQARKELLEVSQESSAAQKVAATPIAIDSGLLENVERIKSSLTELLDIYRQLSSLDSGKTLGFDAEQFEKITQYATEFKTALSELNSGTSGSALIETLEKIQSTLLEFSEVVQRASGQMSTANLEKRFQELREAAQQFEGLNLQNPKNKILANDFMAQYEDYLSAGGTRKTRELKAPRNIRRYLNSHLGEEAGSLREIESATDDAASAKERFAAANRDLLNSVLQSLSGIDNEGKAFENLNKLLNNLGSEKGAAKLEATVNGLKQIHEVLSSPIGADALVRSLENLASSGDALKDLATVLRATKKQIDNAQKATSGESKKNSGLDKLKSDFKELYQDQKDYYQLAEQVHSGNATQKEIDSLAELDARYDSLIQKVKEYDAASEEGRAAQSFLDDYNKKNNDRYNKYLNQFAEGEDNIITKKISGMGLTNDDFASETKEKIEDAAKSAKKLRDILDAGPKDGSRWGADEFKKIYEDAKKVQDVYKEINRGNTRAKNSDIDKLIGKVSHDLNANTISGKLKGQYEDLLDRLRQIRAAGGDAADGLSAISRTDLGKLISESKELHANLESTGQVGKGFVKQFQGAVVSRSAQFLAQYFSLQDFIRYGRNLATTVTDINSALIELRKVSDASNDRIQQSFENSATTAHELGASITDVISSTSDWARLGYSVDDAEKLARTTQLYQNVGDNMTQETASESLISTLKGFQMDASEAESVVDRFNEVYYVASPYSNMRCKKWLYRLNARDGQDRGKTN